MKAPMMPRVSGFGEFPSELGTAVFEKVATSSAGEARQANPGLTPAQAAAASARALARLPTVSKAFREWHERILVTNPEVAMASTRGAIRAMAREPDDAEFQRRFEQLLAKHTHIHIDALPPSKLRAVLQSLAEHTETALKQVTLDLPHPLRRGSDPMGPAALADLVNAVAEMKKNHPEIQIDVDLSNRSLGRDAAMQVAALLRNGVSSLNLSHNQLREESIAIIAKVLPHSRVTDLDLGFNGISHARSFFEALRDSKVSSLNLQANRLEPEDGESLGRVLPECKLHSLDVSMNTFLNTDGVRNIVDGLPRSQVLRVNLMGTILFPTDDGLMRSIGDALLRSQVMDMDLTNNILEPQDEQAIDAARVKAERQRSREIKVTTGFVM